jgi:hypothetical protein
VCVSIARDAKELYELGKAIQEIRVFIEDKYKTSFEHPVALEGAHTDLDCTACHTGQSLTHWCADCHQPPETHLQETCDTCHTPDGWVESAASLVAQSPQIPHSLDERKGCLLCHDVAGDVEPAPTDHRDRAKEQCRLCHKIEP